MALRPSLGLRQSQRVSLTPAMRTSLALLRLSTVELEDELARCAGANPFLVIRPPAQDHQGFEPETLANAPPLAERLRRQIALMNLPANVRMMADFLAGELNDEGFLETDPDLLAAELGVAPCLVTTGLNALQTCEPAGVGARDMAECIALQLREHGLEAQAAAKTVKHLDLFAAREWTALSRVLGLSKAETMRRAAVLKTLRPRPVLPDGPGPAPLRADLVVDRDQNGAMSLRLGQGVRQRVRIDAALADEAAVHGFGNDALEEARAVLAGLQFRGATLLRIGEHLLQHQHRFFDQGPEFLRPMSRSELAAELDLHPSTMGRAVRGKALEADGRLWPMDTFFSKALHCSAGYTISAYAVQCRIAALVRNEPPGAPLSDNRIAQNLRAEGVDIARRTVAKYRRGLRIPSSAGRRYRQRQGG